MATPPAESKQAPTGDGGTFVLLLFASASSYTGLDSLTLPAPLPLAQLFPTLEKKFSGITEKILKSCAVSVNLEYVDMPEYDAVKGNDTATAEGDMILQAGDEVGIIPPVSSG